MLVKTTKDKSILQLLQSNTTKSKFNISLFFIFCYIRLNISKSLCEIYVYSRI